MIDSGKATPESLVNHFINYVICHVDNEKSIAKKAFTPEEFKEKNLRIDYEHYKQTQIFDPVERLCRNINGVSI